MGAVGIFLGIGPLANGQSLLNACDSDDEIRYYVPLDECRSYGDITFKGNDDGPCHYCGSNKCPYFRAVNGANPTTCKCGHAKRSHIDSY